MNFIEAVQSGLPFKRPNYEGYIIRNPDELKIPEGTVLRVTDRDMVKNKFHFIWLADKIPTFFTYTAIVAEDWELKNQWREDE